MQYSYYTVKCAFIYILNNLNIGPLVKEFKQNVIHTEEEERKKIRLALLEQVIYGAEYYFNVTICCGQ